MWAIRKTGGGNDARSDGLRSLKLRVLGGARIYCRPGTTDINVFDDTFVGQFHLPPGDLRPVRSILDLGSNIGLTMAHYAELYRDARILGIELDGGNAALCEKNIERYGSRCRVICGAAWIEDGEVGYMGNSEWGFYATTESRAERRVKAYSVGSLIQQLGVLPVDFVKMDVEGAEKLLLAQGDSWISHVRCLKVEIHEPYTVGACLKDLQALGLECTVDPRHPACVMARNRAGCGAPGEPLVVARREVRE